MKYNIKNASINDIDYLKRAKLFNIFAYAHNLPKDEILRIKAYVDKNIQTKLNEYRIIEAKNKRIGCYLVVKKEDGVMLDEIFIEEKYRNKGIGTTVINNILKTDKIVYLWVYKENIEAISLYKKLGFNVIEETETRYYMKFTK